VTAATPSAAVTISASFAAPASERVIVGFPGSAADAMRRRSTGTSCWAGDRRDPWWLVVPISPSPVSFVDTRIASDVTSLA
jgi:hypothetical protein